MTAIDALIARLDGDLRLIRQGRHHDPHGVLGPHEHRGAFVVIVHLPTASRVRLDRSEEHTSELQSPI